MESPLIEPPASAWYRLYELSHGLHLLAARLDSHEVATQGLLIQKTGFCRRSRTCRVAEVRHWLCLILAHLHRSALPTNQLEQLEQQATAGLSLLLDYNAERASIPRPAPRLVGVHAA